MDQVISPPFMHRPAVSCGQEETGGSRHMQGQSEIVGRCCRLQQSVCTTCRKKTVSHGDATDAALMDSMALCVKCEHASSSTFLLLAMRISWECWYPVHLSKVPHEPNASWAFTHLPCMHTCTSCMRYQTLYHITYMCCVPVYLCVLCACKET